VRRRCFVDEPTSGLNVDNIDAHIQDYVISNNNSWRDVPNDWTALIDGVFQPSGFVCEKSMSSSYYVQLPPGQLLAIVNVFYLTNISLAYFVLIIVYVVEASVEWTMRVLCIYSVHMASIANQLWHYASDKSL